jgi:hypothetical protein
VKDAGRGDDVVCCGVYRQGPSVSAWRMWLHSKSRDNQGATFLLIQAASKEPTRVAAVIHELWMAGDTGGFQSLSVGDTCIARLIRLEKTTATVFKSKAFDSGLDSVYLIEMLRLLGACKLLVHGDRSRPDLHYNLVCFMQL